MVTVLLGLFFLSPLIVLNLNGMMCVWCSMFTPPLYVGRVTMWTQGSETTSSESVVMVLGVTRTKITFDESVKEQKTGDYM